MGVNTFLFPERYIDAASVGEYGFVSRFLQGLTFPDIKAFYRP